MQPVVPPKETPSHACAEKLGRGAATVAKYGREYMSKLGRRGNQVKRERKAHLRDLLAGVESGDDADRQLAEDARVVQWELERAIEAKDYKAVHQMRQDALNRLRGKPAQTHLVAVQQTVKLSDEDLRKVRELTKIIQDAQTKVSSPAVTDVAPSSLGPAPADSGAPASAESPRDLPGDVYNQLLRENGIALPGHPETLPPGTWTAPQRSLSLEPCKRIPR